MYNFGQLATNAQIAKVSAQFLVIRSPPSCGCLTRGPPRTPLLAVACDGKKPCARCLRIAPSKGMDIDQVCVYSAPKKRGPAPGFKRKRSDGDGPEGAPGPQHKGRPAAVRGQGSSPQPSVSSGQGNQPSRGKDPRLKTHKAPGSDGVSASVGGESFAAQSGAYAAGSEAGASGNPVDPFGQWLQALFFPTRSAPIKPSAQEMGYIQSFFIHARSVIPFVDEAEFYTRLTGAGTWPLPISAESVAGLEMGTPGSTGANRSREGSASLSPGPLAGADAHTSANGFVLLYHVVLGIGAAVQGRKVDALVYLQRGLAQLGPALTVPSEMAVQGAILLSLAIARVQASVARAVPVIIAAEGMASSMAQLGKKVGPLTWIVMRSSRLTMTPPGIRLLPPVPNIIPGEVPNDPLDRFVTLLWFVIVECAYGLEGRRLTPVPKVPAPGAVEGGGASKPDMALVTVLLQQVIPALSTLCSADPLMKAWNIPGMLNVAELQVRVLAHMPLPAHLIASAQPWVQKSLSMPDASASIIAVLCARLLVAVRKRGAVAIVDATVQPMGSSLQPLLQLCANLITKGTFKMPEHDMVAGFHDKMLYEAASEGLAALSAAALEGDAASSISGATSANDSSAGLGATGGGNTPTLTGQLMPPGRAFQASLAAIHDPRAAGHAVSLDGEGGNTEMSRVCGQAMDQGREAAAALGLTGVPLSTGKELNAPGTTNAPPDHFHASQAPAPGFYAVHPSMARGASSVDTSIAFMSGMFPLGLSMPIGATASALNQVITGHSASSGSSMHLDAPYSTSGGISVPPTHVHSPSASLAGYALPGQLSHAGGRELDPVPHPSPLLPAL